MEKVFVIGNFSRTTNANTVFNEIFGNEIIALVLREHMAGLARFLNDVGDDDDNTSNKTVSRCYNDYRAEYLLLSVATSSLLQSST